MSYKILHILRSPRAEGTVKLAIDLLQHPGCEQEVFVLEGSPPEMTDILRELAGWIQIDEALPAGGRKFTKMVARTWTVCRERKPDLVICWPNGFGAFILLGAALAGVRRLITHAGNPPTATFKGQAHTVFTTGVVWSLGGRMLCCSKYVARQFSHVPGAFASILSVAYNCAPVRQIREAAEVARSLRTDWRPRLIMVATLESHKDHETLLRAIPAVVRAEPTVQLWLAGDGSQRKRLEDLAFALGLNGAVTFLGSRRDVPALLGQSDVFVFSTTREEGLGSVLIEALAAELPIVASDVPACREVLEDGRWGVLVRSADPAALATALIHSLQSRPTPLIEERQDYLRQFSPRSMIESYIAAVS